MRAFCGMFELAREPRSKLRVLGLVDLTVGLHLVELFSCESGNGNERLYWHSMALLAIEKTSQSPSLWHSHKLTTDTQHS